MSNPLMMIVTTTLVLSLMAILPGSAQSPLPSYFNSKGTPMLKLSRRAITSIHLAPICYPLYILR